MGGSIGKPTIKQLARIDELNTKEILTPTQSNELATLIAKRDSKPELQKGAKTYCENWLKEQIYGKAREFSNKYTEKGIICEPEAIEMIAEYMGYGLIQKNEIHFEDDDITGTPDLLLTEIVDDAKCSWNIYTFPFFAKTLPDSDYFFQDQGYMAITGRNYASTNYCLIDAPEEIIDAEARRVSYKAGLNEVDLDLYNEVLQKMTYKNIDKKYRIKRFEFDRDDTVIEAIRTQVKLCRQYIAKITPPDFNQPSILLAEHGDGITLITKE